MSNITHRIITLASGDFAYPVDELMCQRVRAVRESVDGDWKTNLARNQRPAIPAGQEAVLIMVWHNMDGAWCRIEYDGRVLDIRPLDLQLL